MAKFYGDLPLVRLPSDLTRKHFMRLRNSVESRDLSLNILLCTAVVATALISVVALSFDKN